MSKRIWMSVILFTVFCALSPVYAMGSAPPPKNQEIATETFTPGAYKIYKNDELGFSFKYPKEWYLNRYEKLGFYYYILSNRESRISKSLSEDEIFEIEIYETRLPDRGQQTKGNIIKKISEGLDSIKYFKEINVKEGTVYLVRGSSTMIIGDADFGYLYLIDKKDESGEKSNYLIEFFPTELSKKHEKEYLRILRSVEIFN